MCPQYEYTTTKCRHCNISQAPVAMQAVISVYVLEAYLSYYHRPSSPRPSYQLSYSLIKKDVVIQLTERLLPTLTDSLTQTHHS